MTFLAKINGLASSANETAYVLQTSESVHCAHATGFGVLHAGGVVKLSAQQQTGANFGNGTSLAFFVWGIV